MPARFTFSQPVMKTWMLIHQTHNLLTRSENAVFGNLDLTTRKHAVLLALSNIKGPVTVIDVARWLDRNANGISMLVDRMERDGLVSRVRDLPDRRTVRLEMTPKGEKILKEANKLSKEMIRDVFSELSEEEMANVSAMLDKVRNRTFSFLKLEKPSDVQVLPEQPKA